MKLCFKISVLIASFFLAVLPALSQGHDSQLSVYKNVLDNEGTYKVNRLKLSINPSSTVLVVIDFWDNVAPQRYIDNLINLIGLARSQEIPVIFFSHEKPLNSQLEVSDKDIVLDGSRIVLENYLYNNGLDIKTILFAGFHTDACLTITRLNSVSRISWRSPDYKIIVVKDCTYSSYWQYLWAMNSIETRFQTTTLPSLTAALTRNPELQQEALPFQSIDREQTKYSSLIEEYRKKYKPDWSGGNEDERNDNLPVFNGLSDLLTYDSTFGLEEDWPKHALVVLNPSTGLSSKVWEKRARANINRNVSRMVEFARRKNMEVVYFTENSLIDAAIRAESNEKHFDHPDSMFSYLQTKDIEDLIYIGNITSASQHFTPLDAWRFTIFNNGFNVVFLEDCLITNELPVTLEQQIFKKLFLEAATFYRAQYQVSTLSVLYQNLPEISINEFYLDPDHGTLTIELFNRGGLPLELSRFTFDLGPEIPLRSVSTSPKILSPGKFHLVKLSNEELPFDPQLTRLYLLDRYNQKIDSIDYSKQQSSLGKFPDGGSQFVKYDKSSLGKSNYEIEQEKSLCEGEGTVKLKVNGSEALSYAWSMNDSVKVFANSAEVAIEEEGVYSVVLSYGDNVSTSTIGVERIPSPIASWEMDGDLNFCADQKPMLRANLTADYSYYWIHDDIIVGTQSEYQVQSSGYYSLLVKDKFGCSTQSDAVELTQQESGSPCVKEKIIVSPNPSNGRISMLIADDVEITKIELYDTNGRLVYECEDYSEKTFPNRSSSYDIQLASELESGLYLLMVKGRDLYYVERIVLDN